MLKIAKEKVLSPAKRAVVRMMSCLMLIKYSVLSCSAGLHKDIVVVGEISS